MMITKKTKPQKYCWTGIPTTGGLTGGYGKNLAECKKQAKREKVNIHNKFAYWEGLTPKDLRKRKYLEKVM